MKRKSLLTFGLLISITSISFSQLFLQPNYGLKSHETLLINKIEATSKAITFYFTVTNKIEGGNFCADPNIFMIYPDGTRIKLISATGIPVCPEAYKFKTIGESLDFVLAFPPLKQGTKWVDLVEDCSDNCFSIFGITLDNELNRKIDEAFFLAENEQPLKAMISFINIADANDNLNLGIEGLLYVNIIKLAEETGNTGKAAEWYKRLKTSGAPRVSQYYKYLKDLDISY